MGNPVGVTMLSFGEVRQQFPARSRRATVGLGLPATADSVRRVRMACKCCRSVGQSLQFVVHDGRHLSHVIAEVSNLALGPNAVKKVRQRISTL